MSFLPEDYEAPRIGNYMRLQPGENKFRILSKPILGWLDWDDKKPVRYRYSPKAPKSIVESKPCKHFWAFVVYNYSESKIQILEVAQATIRNDLESMSNDPDLGAPFFYDIKITKSGEGTKTKYTVMALPPKPITAAVQQAFKETPCCLEALYDGANPFEPHPERTPTEGIFSKDDLEKASVFGDHDQLAELKDELAIDRLPVEHVEEYIALRAKEKKLGVEQVIAGALVKEVLPRFKQVYRKWCDEKYAEAVPF